MKQKLFNLERQQMVGSIEEPSMGQGMPVKVATTAGNAVPCGAMERDADWKANPSQIKTLSLAKSVLFR